MCIMYLTGKLQEARKVLGDAVAVLEKSPTVSSDYCKVSCMATNYHLRDSMCRADTSSISLTQALLEDLQRSLESVKSEVQYKSHGRQYIVSK